MAVSSELENEVIGLLQTRRYDPEILPRLEEYVDQQVAAGAAAVDADANLAVLKLYQFYPSRYDARVVAKILIKALMTLPSTDFLCALYLVPDRRQVDEPIPVISKLAALLETGCFKEFWEASGACTELLQSVPGSLDAIRDFMASVVARTYKTIDRHILAEILSLHPSDIDAVAASHGWSLDSADVVVIPANAENQPKPPTSDEQLTFRQVAAKMLVNA